MSACFTLILMLIALVPLGFSFPKDNRRRTLWAHRVRRQNWKPTDTSFLCSKHFSSDSYEAPTEFGKRKNLKKDAVPTIFARPTLLALKKNLRRKGKRRQLKM